jgi:hypothetical protein
MVRKARTACWPGQVKSTQATAVRPSAGGSVARAAIDQQRGDRPEAGRRLVAIVASVTIETGALPGIGQSGLACRQGHGRDILDKTD